MKLLKTLVAAPLLACAALWAHGSFAQARDCPATPTLEQIRAATTGRDHGPLWRLEKDGRESWLYGTIHLSRIEWVVPGPRVVAAIRASDVVALELDLTDPQTVADVMAAARPQEGARGLSPALGERMRAAAQRSCTPPAVLAAQQPLMRLMTITAMTARHSGLFPELAIDAVIAGAAGGAGKRVLALETPAQQLTLLRIPEARLERLLARSLAQLESGQAERVLVRLARAWAEGDEQDMLAYPEWCECVSDPVEREFMTRLVDGRNPAMADRVAALHAEGQRVFAAVGTLHMLGPRGLVELLRERGFAVERIRFNAEPNQ